MGTDQFIDILRVLQVAHLTSSVYPMELLAREGVPEADTSVGCATTTAHDTMLMGVPGNGFDCGHVFVKFVNGFIEMSFLPDHQFIVISTGCELLFIRAPLETTHFLFVSFELCKEVILNS